MSRIATDQTTIVERVAARLITQLSGFTAANCYTTVEPDPIFDLNHHLFIQVSPGDGRFNEGALAGGGEHTCFEHATTWVTVFNRVRLDQANRADMILKEASRGLLGWKFEILKALTDHDLADDNGDNILINLMAPISATRPQLYRDTNVASVGLVFSTDFEWKLTS